MSTFLITLHVVAAVFVVGPMAILPMTAMRAVRAGQGGQVAALARSTSVFSLISLAVAVLGFGALGVSDPKDHYTVTTPWVLISFIAYLIALTLTLLAVVPALRSAAEHLAGPAGAEPASSDYRRIGVVSGVAALLLVVVVVLMVWKP